MKWYEFFGVPRGKGNFTPRYIGYLECEDEREASVHAAVHGPRTQYRELPLARMPGATIADLPPEERTDGGKHLKQVHAANN